MSVFSVIYLALTFSGCAAAIARLAFNYQSVAEAASLASALFLNAIMVTHVAYRRAYAALIVAASHVPRHRHASIAYVQIGVVICLNVPHGVVVTTASV